MRRVLAVLGACVGVVVVLCLGLVAVTEYRYRRVYAPPLPAIAAATSPAALARGRELFASSCAPCHVDRDNRAVGKVLDHFPAFMGTVRSANLTGDPVDGIGSWTDRELARMIRTQIDRDGRFRPMPTSTRFLGDDDVAAILGFLRSGDPLFAPRPDPPGPPSAVSFAGRALFVWMLGIPVDTAVSIPTPEHAATVEYGRYMATILECWMCHTGGFDTDKLTEPGVYGGGFEMGPAPGGTTVVTPNITVDPVAGIGGWSEEAFATVLRDGIAPDGRVMRAPMPRYRYQDDVTFEAIWAYLHTVPAVAAVPAPGTARVAKRSAAADPRVLWSEVGCDGCHDAGMADADRIDGARGKTPEQVAAWIRHPEAIRPGTQMPTFAAVLDEDQALALAGWVLAGRPR